MVYHLGIHILRRQVLAYNDETRKTTKIKLKQRKFNLRFILKLLYRYQLNKIITTFLKQLRSTINGKFGCVCIIGWPSCGNIIRKRLIESCWKIGFERVQISDGNSLLFLNEIIKSKFTPEEGDFVWLFHSKTHGLKWEYHNGTFIFYNSPVTSESIKLELKNGKLKKPAIILCKSSINLDKYFPEVEPLQCKMVFYEKSNVFKGALLNARILSGDKNLIKYNTSPMNLTNILISHGGEKIKVIAEFDPLPTAKTFAFTLKKDFEKMQILVNGMKDSVFYPHFQNFFMIFSVNKNGIYSIKCLPLPLASSDIDTYIEFLYVPHIKIKKDNQIKFAYEKKYFVPEPIYTNDDEINAIGIDMGSSKCCVAVNRRSGIETIPLDNMGERLLPTYVSFDEENDKCGKIVITRLRNHANASVFDLYNIIGKKPEDIIPDDFWTFGVINFNQRPVIQLCSKNKDIYKYPEEVASVLLKQIKQRAEEFQGKCMMEIVISVPPATKRSQIDAIRISANIAGWTRVHFIPDVIAVAFAYLTQIPEINPICNILVFDLGQSSLNLCILQHYFGEIKVKALVLDSETGGKSFDKILMKYFTQKMSTICGYRMPESKKLKFLLLCQEIKHRLSVVEEETFEMEELDPSNEDSIRITQKIFETLAVEIMSNIEGKIDEILNKNGSDAKDIDIVLQVGGGSRMPMMKNMLNKKFFNAAHFSGKNPDEAVAIGAAYYSYYLQDIHKLINPFFAKNLIKQGQQIA